MRRTRIGLGVIGLLTMAGVQPAIADAIDGNWCSDDGRRMSITGPSIVTPGGTRTQGSYTRHSFVYTVPASEPESGQEVSMRLMSEIAVQVRVGPVDRPVQTWHRCTAATT
jgi:hypothetical protein